MSESYVQTTALASSNVSYTLTQTAILTIQFDYYAEASEDRGMVLDNDVSGTNNYRGVIDGGSGDSNVRVAGLYIDGVLSIASNRGDLHAALHDGQWHTVKYVAWSNAATDDGSTFPAGMTILFGRYWSDSYSATCRLRNFKVDYGNTGTWDAESELGDDNGFSQSNVTVVASETTGVSGHSLSIPSSTHALRLTR